MLTQSCKADLGAIEKTSNLKESASIPPLFYFGAPAP